jgi:hypothetical protein
MDRKQAEAILKEHGFKPGMSTSGHPASAEIKQALRVVATHPKPKQE